MAVKYQMGAKGNFQGGIRAFMDKVLNGGQDWDGRHSRLLDFKIGN